MTLWHVEGISLGYPQYGHGNVPTETEQVQIKGFWIVPNGQPQQPLKRKTWLFIIAKVVIYGYIWLFNGYMWLFDD